MKIGIIGGSGLYALDGLTGTTTQSVDTPFGPPSDDLFCGQLGDVELIFLPRHGRGHRLMPGELNHRANIFALKSMGVEQVLSVSAVGSFRDDMAPGDVVLVDQFVDRTKRAVDHTFFGNGMVAHISFAHPTCAGLRDVVRRVGDNLLEKSGNPDHITIHDGGTYVNMEGPAFSTLAESRLYQAWGMDVIGMTNLAEAKLAREAEMCYQTLAMVTDYDCWHPEHDAVTVETVIAVLTRNAVLANELVRCAAKELAGRTDCECRHALANAIITDAAAVPETVKESLKPIIGKYVQ